MVKYDWVYINQKTKKVTEKTILKIYFIETVLHTLKHTAVLIPFLFITYLLMELIEHRASEKTVAVIGRTGKLGPLFGGILGAIPQCGFSAAASGLYSGHVISIGTLIAVYLSTSDEMVAVMLSGAVKDPKNIKILTTVLIIKIAAAVLSGFAIDIILSNKRHRHNDIENVCDSDGCLCGERGIFLSSLLHTAKIFGFIIAVTFIINNIVFFIGEESLGRAMKSIPVLGEFIAGIIGLIPNCASSVVITELYLDGIITPGQMLAGLFTGSGIGLAVLFKSNKNIKENLTVLATVYLIGVMLGITVGETGLAAALGL